MIATIKKIFSTLKTLVKVAIILVVLMAVIFAAVMAMLAAIPFWAECIGMGPLLYFRAEPNAWQGVLYTIYTLISYFTMAEISKKI